MKKKKVNLKYFSDGFIFVIMIIWCLQILWMNIVGTYSTFILYDNSVWCEVQLLVTAPISAGVFTWMLKNISQHYFDSKSDEPSEDDFIIEDNPEEELTDE